MQERGAKSVCVLWDIVNVVKVCGDRVVRRDCTVKRYLGKDVFLARTLHAATSRDSTLYTHDLLRAYTKFVSL